MSAPADSARPARLRLQINTSGAWRNVIDFARDDDLACAQVLVGAPLLAEVGRATLRICSADGRQEVHSRWSAEGGWRGAVQ